MIGLNICSIIVILELIRKRKCVKKLGLSDATKYYTPHTSSSQIDPRHACLLADNMQGLCPLGRWEWTATRQVLLHQDIDLLLQVTQIKKPIRKHMLLGKRSSYISTKSNKLLNNVQYLWSLRSRGARRSYQALSNAKWHLFSKLWSTINYFLTTGLCSSVHYWVIIMQAGSPESMQGVQELLETTFIKLLECMI